MAEAYSDYFFHITEGPQTQEILVGVKSGFSPFFTQRVEFKGGNPRLRPSALHPINGMISTTSFPKRQRHIGAFTESS